MILSDFLTGTDMFQLRHIISMVLSVAVIVIGAILAIKHIKDKTFVRILLIVGIVSETLKVFSYIMMNETRGALLGGYLPKTDLPFHLCSIQLIFILILNFSKNEKLKHLIQGFMIPTCLIGGIAAIILATSSARSNWVITFQYYGFHAAITAYAIYLLANKDIKFTVKDYRNTIIMLIATLFVAIYLNSILYYKEFDAETYNELIAAGTNEGEAIQQALKLKDINFMYVVNPPQSGLPFLNEDHGWIVYMAHYASLAILVVTLCYIKPIIDFFKNKGKVETAEQA